MICNRTRVEFTLIQFLFLFQVSFLNFRRATEVARRGWNVKESWREHSFRAGRLSGWAAQNEDLKKFYSQCAEISVVTSGVTAYPEGSGWLV